MSVTMAPLRAEHRELLPHVEELRAARASRGGAGGACRIGSRASGAGLPHAAAGDTVARSGAARRCQRTFLVAVVTAMGPALAACPGIWLRGRRG